MAYLVHDALVTAWTKILSFNAAQLRMTDGGHPPGARGPWRVATGAWLEGHATRIVR